MGWRVFLDNLTIYRASVAIEMAGLQLMLAPSRLFEQSLLSN